MIVKDLLRLINNREKLYNEYLRYFNIENKTGLTTIREQAILQLNIFMNEMLEVNIENIANKSVVFVVKQEKINEENKSIEPYIDSFLCLKQDIYEKTENGEISIWGDCNNKIKHYGYDVMLFKNVLAQDVYIDEGIEKEEALANIMINMSRMGFTENEKKKKLIE